LKLGTSSFICYLPARRSIGAGGVLGIWSFLSDAVNQLSNCINFVFEVGAFNDIPLDFFGAVHHGAMVLATQLFADEWKRHP